MSTQQDNTTRTFTAAEAISAWTRVGITTTAHSVYAAPASNVDVGVAQHDAASGDQVAVKLYKPTQSMMVSGAVTAGSQVYAAASGKVGGSAVGTAIGAAVEAATADRDIIEIAQFI